MDREENDQALEGVAKNIDDPQNQVDEVDEGFPDFGDDIGYDKVICCFMIQILNHVHRAIEYH